RNALATRLKKAGNRVEAEQVKALSKPSVSTWAINQLYWKHERAFKELVAAGEGTAHASQGAGKGSDIRELLSARPGETSQLTRLAADLLTDAGHNPAPETMRRIPTTLEALSANTPLPDGERPGRLTADLDPPGFESIAALVPNIRRERAGEVAPDQTQKRKER